MKLSTKGRYGARMMLDLAIHYGNGPILLKDIALRQEISEKYLGQLILPLKASGLVSSSRGAHGGYALAKAPGKITLGEVVRSVEGELAIVECVKSPAICRRVNSCVTRDVWEEISEKVNEVLDSITLEDMADRHSEKKELHPLMYSI